MILHWQHILCAWTRGQLRACQSEQ